MTTPLQQLADEMCRGFGGWHLSHDRQAHAVLESGMLEVDLLTKRCRLNRRFIPTLAIVERLRGQLLAFLAECSLEPDAIKAATLSVELEIEEHDDQKDHSVMWLGDRNGFVGCDMRLQSLIETTDQECRSAHRAYVEWPREPA